MNDIDYPIRIDIRDRLRALGARQLVIARLNAPIDWESSLRHAISQHRYPRTKFGASDLKLFLESFATFFTAAIMFLI